MDIQTPKPPRLLGFRLTVYLSPQFLQINERFYHPLPASPFGRKNQSQHGPFAPSALPDFFAPTGHSVILFAFGPFPVSTVIGPILSRNFSWGKQDFSSFHHGLVTVSPLIPRR